MSEKETTVSSCYPMSMMNNRLMLQRFFNEKEEEQAREKTTTEIQVREFFLHNECMRKLKVLRIK